MPYKLSKDFIGGHLELNHKFIEYHFKRCHQTRLIGYGEAIFIHIHLLAGLQNKFGRTGVSENIGTMQGTRWCMIG